jgi:nicotinamide riboside kinase
VADGQKESGELVVVDRYKHFIHSSLFCEGTCIHFRLLSGTPHPGHFWFNGLEKECFSIRAGSKQNMKKIVILGPECTGKSTLAGQLATHYGTVWCPEFARDYLLEYGTDYVYDDLLHIARGQLNLQDRLEAKAKNLYFIDTDMYVMKVWCEVAFNNCPTWILKQIARRNCDLYLLCDVDLPWVQDGLREYPDPVKRAQLYKMYKELMINSSTPWAVISGSWDERLETAVAIVDSLLVSPGKNML